MQPGIVGLRGAITALVARLRVPIQQAWGPGGLVHVADNPDVAGPGQRVSQTRVKLRNHGEAVVVEAFAYKAGSPNPDPGLGLDREIKVAEIGASAFVHELYRTMVFFLQTALTADLSLADSAWLYEQLAADYFTAN